MSNEQEPPCAPQQRKLTPKAAALLAANDETRKAHINSDHWYGYSFGMQLLKEWRDLIDGNLRIRALHRVLIAPANYGKTALLRRLENMYPSLTNTDAETDYRPLISAEMTSICSVDHLFGMLLLKLGLPWDCVPTRTGDRLIVATSLARRQGCRAVLLDNLQNVLVGRSGQQFKTMTSIRAFANEVGCHFICTGTRGVENVVTLDGQDHSRFHRQRLRRWRTGSELDKLMRSVEATFPLHKSSGLDRPELRDFVLEKGEGALGEMLEFLKASGRFAIDDGSEQITLTLLEKVISEEIWTPPANRRDMGEEAA
jgi:hypothetical protein